MDNVRSKDRTGKDGLFSYKEGIPGFAGMIGQTGESVMTRCGGGGGGEKITSDFNSLQQFLKGKISYYFVPLLGAVISGIYNNFLRVK